MPSSTPPFAPQRALFPFAGLVALAAKAPLGGSREALLGAMMAARLAQGLRTPHPLPLATRRARAEAAKGWLVAVAVPTKLRTVLQRAFALSAGEDRAAMADAVVQVTDITAPHLDRNARSELVRLADALRKDGAALAGVVDRPVE